MPEITVKLGDQILQTCKFEGELLRIGRSRENDVVLENLSVSRQHAQIRLYEGRFILTDLNSANGTLVNGVRVTKTEIVDDDLITIGKHKLHFQNSVLADATMHDDSSTQQRTIMVEHRAEAWLEVDSGRLKGREFKITRFETSLGKAPTNDVVLTDDWLLGKKQAIILRKGNHSFEIHDLGGLRRVKINGTAIAERADLKDGDRIEMGGTALIFRSTEGPPKPEGRMPSELGANVTTPPEMPAALAKEPDPEPEVTPNEPFVHDLENESLDLEDGYQSVKITLTSQQSAPIPSGEDEANTTTGANPEAAKAVSQNGDRQRNVFEDTRSTGRRKRKHHQRAAQRLGNPGIAANAEEPGANSVSIKENASPASNALPDEKEIQIWEAALNNASPAIRRQAARMLKKLTGRDYEV